jgi:5'-methylthioadenosine/S-adenosylhomocysteine nucleosidase
MKVVIITALPLEFQAVKGFLKNCQEIEHPHGNVYETGKYQNWEVELVEIGQGNAKAAAETERAIEFFKPEYVFFVGVAGGIKDVNLGDVVIAEVVKGYEKGKETDTGFLPRGEIGQSSYQLIQRAKANAKNADWFEKLNTNLKPKALIGVIAAGEKVVASERSTTYEILTKLYSDALAVEMEGIGFLTAIHASNAKGIVIRGISDLLSNKTQSDNAGWQEKAAYHATAFAFAMLDKLAPIHEENTSIAQEKPISQINKPEKTLKLFYSYSHEDEDLRNRLEKHLTILKRQNVIDTWHDRAIGAGTEWKEAIDENLETADIILLLVSADFLASDYCFDIEIKRAMEKHNEKSAVVIPISLRPCDTNDIDFMKLQGLPRNFEPVIKWVHQDEAFTDIAKGIRAVAERIRNSK